MLPLVFYNSRLLGHKDLMGRVAVWIVVDWVVGKSLNRVVVIQVVVRFAVKRNKRIRARQRSIAIVAIMVIREMKILTRGTLAPSKNQPKAGLHYKLDIDLRRPES